MCLSDRCSLTSGASNLQEEVITDIYIYIYMGGLIYQEKVCSAISSLIYSRLKIPHQLSGVPWIGRQCYLVGVLDRLRSVGWVGWVGDLRVGWEPDSGLHCSSSSLESLLLSFSSIEDAAVNTNKRNRKV